MNYQHMSHLTPMLLFWLLGLPIWLAAQEKEDPTNLIVGTSFAYIPIEDMRPTISGEPLNNHELTWNLNFGVQVHPIYRISVENKLILFKGIDTPWDIANVTGITHQFNVVPQLNHRIFGEIGTHLGNYCVCVAPSIRTTDPTFYLSVGAGGAIWLGPKWDLDLGLQANFAFLSGGNLGSYTQYTVGLDYYFKPRVQKPDVLLRRL